MINLTNIEEIKSDNLHQIILIFINYTCDKTLHQYIYTNLTKYDVVEIIREYRQERKSQQKIQRVIDKIIRENSKQILINERFIAKFIPPPRPKFTTIERLYLWLKYNKIKFALIGICFCCEKELLFSNMQLGHVVARALDILNPKIDNYDNLRPICKICNENMKLMNLFEYKRSLQNRPNNSH